MAKKELNAKESQPVEIKKVKGSLSDKGAVLRPNENINDLTARGYGTMEDEKMTLEFYEALYLRNKDILEVQKPKSRKTLSFQEMLHHFEVQNESVWVKYLIYRDLRSRGYVVRKGFGLGLDFRVYARGEYGKATAEYLVLGIREGKPVSVDELAKTLKHAQSLKKKLVLAVLNRRGEVVYYTLSKLTLKKQ